MGIIDRSMVHLDGKPCLWPLGLCNEEAAVAAGPNIALIGSRLAI